MNREQKHHERPKNPLFLGTGRFTKQLLGAILCSVTKLQTIQFVHEIT